MSEDTSTPIKNRPAYRDRIIGGGGGGGKGGGGRQGPAYGVQYRTPVEDPNTLQSKATARFIDLICEGPIVGLVTNDGRSVYFNDTPVLNPNLTHNFEGVTIDQRTGAGWGFQTAMPGYPSASNVVPVGGAGGGVLVEYTNGTADVGGVVCQIQNTDATSAIVRVSTPALYRQQKETGDVHGSSISFKIYLKVDGGNYYNVYAGNMIGKTMSPYHRDIRISLPAGQGPWTVKVIRTDAPNPDESLENLEKHDLYFVSVTELVDTNLAYPWTALVGVTVDTSQFSGGAPSRSYDIKGLIVRVPSNYNPTTRAYSGDWNGAFTWAWTDNPVWCFYDLLTNKRYGVGMPEEAIAPWKWELYEISKYCDELIPDGNGQYRPRFTCNMILNSQQEAYTVINTMASIFRGMCYWSAGAVRVTADMPKSPVALLTNANVIEGTFNYEGTALKARHSICKVVWNDPDDSYRAHVEYVEHPEAMQQYGPRQTDIVAYGATNRAQAIRAGRWLLDTEYTATETVHFRGGLDMAGIFPGMIVEIADQDYADSVFGGRIVTCDSVSRATLTIDRDYTFDSQHTYTLDIMLPSGTIATKTLTNSAGTTRDLTWAGPLPEVPLDGAVWIIRSTALSPRQFMILSNTEVGPATFELFGVFHDPAKYARVDLDIVTPPPHYSLVPTGDIVKPTNLATLLRLYTVGSAIRAAAVVSWEAADDSRVYAYEVQVKGPADTQFVSLHPTTSMTSIEYKDLIEGAHQFRVRSVSMTGKYSAWSDVLDVELTSDIPPSDVTGIRETFDPNGVAFKWDPNPDLNLDHYEVRRGVSWDAGVMVSRQSETIYAEKSVVAGDATYWVKAVSAPSGKYSVNATGVTVTVIVPAQPNVVATLSEQDYNLRWNAVIGSFQIDHYEVRYGSTWETATVLGTTKATVWEAIVRWSGLRTFWVAGVDIAGNVGVPDSVDLLIEPPSAIANLTAQVIDNNVLLRWGASAAGRLPIQHYEIRRGSVYASAEIIGTKSGTFTSIMENTSGTYTYWVTAVDTAGNYGPETSVNSFVDQPPDYILHSDLLSDFSGTKTNVDLDGGTLFVPVDTAETWENHFISRSWSSPQDQINAGYPIYIQPVPTTAQYQEVVDYGTSIPTTLISVDVTKTDSGGTVGVDYTIETSLDGSSWTTVATGPQGLGSNFRYVRYTLDFTSDGKAVTDVTSIRYLLSVKQKTDNGQASALASDPSGTTVNFNLPFIDVLSIVVTPMGTSQLTAVVDFVDVPNPTSFKVLVFDSTGARVNSNVSWTVRGV